MKSCEKILPYVLIIYWHLCGTAVEYGIYCDALYNIMFTYSSFCLSNILTKEKYIISIFVR